jgi:hypothetical protein
MVTAADSTKDRLQRDLGIARLLLGGAILVWLLHLAEGGADRRDGLEVLSVAFSLSFALAAALRLLRNLPAR